MRVIVLDTGLFPERDMIESALQVLAKTHDLRRIDLANREMDQQDWDRVLAEILDCEKVITI